MLALSDMRTIENKSFPHFLPHPLLFFFFSSITQSFLRFQSTSCISAYVPLSTHIHTLLQVAAKENNQQQEEEEENPTINEQFVDRKRTKEMCSNHNRGIFFKIPKVSTRERHRWKRVDVRKLRLRDPLMSK